jgi:putative flippase GtrA
MDMLGLYPLFYVPHFGSAWLMGLTGAIHIMASHTSVGAALLFAFLAHRAQKENRTDLYDYMKRYGMFLLIFYRFHHGSWYLVHGNGGQPQRD